MVVKVTDPSGWWQKYPCKVDDPREAIMTTISTKVYFTRPGRIEWVVNPLSGETILAMIQDAEGVTTLEVVAES